MRFTRLKRILASELANENNCDTNLLAHAAALSAKKQERQGFYSYKKTTTTPEYSTESRKQCDIQKPIPLTPDEALAFRLENSLTKQQYMNTRLMNKNRHSNIIFIQPIV